MINWKTRLKAATIHLGLSLTVAALAAALVFGLWYPYPYREIAGGRDLFWLVVAVDVALGPLITLVIFNRAKPRRELLTDLSLVAVIQLAALAYGLWTVLLTRPVHLVFEYDRFRVVHAIDVPESELVHAPTGLRSLPLTGPTVLALRQLRHDDDQFQLTMQALNGVPIAARPGLWRPYETEKDNVLKAAKPLAQLSSRFPDQAAAIAQAIATTGLPAERLVYLPLAGRKDFWTALMDAQTAQPLAYFPLDSF